MSNISPSSTRSPSLRQAQAALAARQTTALALTRQALGTAENCKHSVNAFSVIAWDRALQAAADSDVRISQGRPRQLEGLPIAVKDLIDTKDVETHYGSQAYLGHLPTADADIVQVLVAQGAIPIGKTTTHEFAWGVTTSSAAFGNTLNPLDRSRIPGGSSGGAAAAIAFGAIAASLGTDTGGSVRIPAALCGVVGFKPTFGTLSTRGVFPLAPTLDHPGLLGESVDDVAILADALQIKAPGSGAWVSARVGVLREIAPIPLSPEVARAFDSAIACIEEVFACVKFDALDLFDAVYEAFASIVLTEGAIEHFKRNDWGRIVTHYGAQTVERLERAKALALGDYSQAQQTRRRFAAHLRERMSALDYLLLPTCPCTAPLLDAQLTSIGHWSGTVREALMTYTAPFNMAGFPAISIPLVGVDGALPASLQIVARPGQDGALLQIALQMERILRGKTPSRQPHGHHQERGDG
ncbi:amidase, Asp-tRNAAsn/Glu-tRNAGln amidotransferase A subunit [Acidovorax sp. CF316]|uniref:amidase n=1 Tax=Acidovorax sp. CF316 TaxID=1144317 RepID=UPI00026BDF29|nr:amidase [Acidovorax sp. CF316]EJE51114.1 amidase, Asp-tRNAAsn/Glu-tRNAGln amidotransferase A subunit [Acidovorax sp. CF316]